MKTYSLFFFLLSFLLLFNSCKKEAGEGGTSHIKGRVHADYYNKNFSTLSASAYAPDIDVYIIYGDEHSYGDRIRTSYNGAFEFKYLQKGKYTIFAYSKDSTGAYSNHVNQYAPDKAIIKEVEITNNKQTIELEDIEIVQ
ncbi:MAG: hypothetical protein WAQ28_04935 [Bacteroidia bacterium]